MSELLNQIEQEKKQQQNAEEQRIVEQAKESMSKAYSFLMEHKANPSYWKVSRKYFHHLRPNGHAAYEGECQIVVMEVKDTYFSNQHPAVQDIWKNFIEKCQKQGFLPYYQMDYSDMGTDFSGIAFMEITPEYLKFEKDDAKHEALVKQEEETESQRQKRQKEIERQDSEFNAIISALGPYIIGGLALLAIWVYAF